MDTEKGIQLTTVHLAFPEATSCIRPPRWTKVHLDQVLRANSINPHNSPEINGISQRV